MSNDEFRALSGLARLDGFAAPEKPTPDAAAALQALELRGYVERLPYYPENTILQRRSAWRVTDAGRLALTDYRVERAQMRWTRGLAIAALLISIGSLIVSVLSQWPL